MRSRKRTVADSGGGPRGRYNASSMVSEEQSVDRVTCQAYGKYNGIQGAIM